MNTTDLRTIPEDTTLSADVAVVGSGPAGFTLAAELDRSGIKVLLIESGDLECNAWSESLNETISVGVPRSTGETRNRALGGTSVTWGGRMTTLSEIDFRQRAWVPESGWPIAREALMPYYRRAAEHAGMTIVEPNDALGVLASFVPPPDGDALLSYLWAYAMHPSLIPDFLRLGARARTLPLPNVQCLLNATVTHVDTDEGGRRVQRLEVMAPDRRRRFVTAPHTVLCAGGIENARLLLASNRVVPAGLGNEHDLVGRYLMDHPRGLVARFPNGHQYEVESLLGDLNLSPSRLPKEARLSGFRRRTWLTPGYALAPIVQEREALLNAAIFLTLEIADDDPLTALLALASRQGVSRNLRHLVGHPRVLLDSIGRVARGRQPARRLAGVYAQCIVEQSPNADSRVTLSEQSDLLGVPMAVVDWRTSEQEARTVRRITELFVELMGDLGLATPEPAGMITDKDSEFFLPDVAHPSGTTRMAADPRRGVVDADCAVHGMEGLHVVGSSVFPTNGHANPTYSVMALAVRLADRLKERLRHGS
jgi:choline dehydrogenase-like flavoprotein